MRTIERMILWLLVAPALIFLLPGILFSGYFIYIMEIHPTYLRHVDSPDQHYRITFTEIGEPFHDSSSKLEILIERKYLFWGVRERHRAHIKNNGHPLSEVKDTWTVDWHDDNIQITLDGNSQESETITFSKQ